MASGSKTGFVWALSNLILCVTGALLAVITLIRALTRRNKEEDGYMSDYSERRNRSRSLWLTLTVAAGAVGVILFFLTENISLPMVLTDSWTVANALIFAAEAVCMGLVSKRGKDGGEDGSSGLLETSAT